MNVPQLGMYAFLGGSFTVVGSLFVKKSLPRTAKVLYWVGAVMMGVGGYCAFAPK